MDNEFVELAKELLLETIIIAKGIEFQICEVEMYKKCAEHSDGYVHCAKEQLMDNKWYFHRNHGKSYKVKTYKGLDITFGSEKDNIYFGVLIRGAREIESGKIFQGPCVFVNRVLEIYGVGSVDELLKNLEVPLDISENKLNFIVKTRDELFSDKIYRGPRIGLSDKYMEFRDRPYRFLTYYDVVKKGKKDLKKMD